MARWQWMAKNWAIFSVENRWNTDLAKKTSGFITLTTTLSRFFPGKLFHHRYPQIICHLLHYLAMSENWVFHGIPPLSYHRIVRLIENMVIQQNKALYVSQCFLVIAFRDVSGTPKKYKEIGGIWQPVVRPIIPSYGGFHQLGYPNSWLVYKGKSNLKMDDDFGVPLWLRKPP